MLKDKLIKECVRRMITLGIKPISQNENIVDPIMEFYKNGKIMKYNTEKNYFTDLTTLELEFAKNLELENKDKQMKVYLCLDYKTDQEDNFVILFATPKDNNEFVNLFNNHNCITCWTFDRIKEVLRHGIIFNAQEIFN